MLELAIRGSRYYWIWLSFLVLIIMAGFAANLSQQDMEDLGAYFAAQSGDLFTPTEY